VLALALAVPILYVLSVGPAVWLLSRGIVSERPLVFLYTPLEVAPYSGTGSNAIAKPRGRRGKDTIRGLVRPGPQHGCGGVM
jgi:hypothetical protein